MAQRLTILIPIHDGDLIKGKKQWYTRLLYNAYTPFAYTLVLDTHVYPCYNTSYSEIFRLFKLSRVDISYSNRMNIKHVSGAAVLTKWGPRSFQYWMKNIKFMIKRKSYDDQLSAVKVLNNQKGYRFKLMSSNWFFASNGISEAGVFTGASKCYRSSVVVNGPIQWIHGKPSDCQVMNGEHDEHIYKKRVYFRCGFCKCGGSGPTVATSSQELQEFVGKQYKTPELLWGESLKRRNNSLFWYY